ncbi:hypothetical protein E1165_07020, partial [Micromonospora sp. KC723]
MLAGPGALRVDRRAGARALVGYGNAGAAGLLGDGHSRPAGGTGRARPLRGGHGSAPTGSGGPAGLPGYRGGVHPGVRPGGVSGWPGTGVAGAYARSGAGLGRPGRTGRGNRRDDGRAGRSPRWAGRRRAPPGGGLGGLGALAVPPLRVTPGGCGRGRWRQRRRVAALRHQWLRRLGGTPPAGGAFRRDGATRVSAGGLDRRRVGCRPAATTGAGVGEDRPVASRRRRVGTRAAADRGRIRRVRRGGRATAGATGMTGISATRRAEAAVPAVRCGAASRVRGGPATGRLLGRPVP